MDTQRQHDNNNLESLFSNPVEVPERRGGIISFAAKLRRAKRTGTRALVAAGVIGIAGTGIGAAGFVNGVSDAFAIKAETVGRVINPGVATIVDVNMDIPPITLATATTEVTGTKVGFEHKLTGLIDLSLGETTVTRDATVETKITIDPNEVTISYDSENQQLTFSALDTSLATSVDIPTGQARTVDETGSLWMLPAEWLTDFTNAIDGTFGTDNSTVPLVRDIANGTLAINEALEKYADLNIVTQVDKECTPLIPQEVEDFEEQLKDNIREVVKGQLLNPEATNKISRALLSMSLAEVQEVVDNSIVEIPGDFVIGPDQSNIDELEAYKSSEVFSSTLDDESQIICGVSEDTKLSLVEEAN